MIDYEYLVDSAMRVLIKDVLTSIEKHGITGGHYFHITFVTQYDGLLIPKHLIEKYPNEITIALQNQFKNLNVYEDTFGVDLSFNGKDTRLVVPFCAITAFADPSVDFTLRMLPDNMGMLGKSKFHEMISSGEKTNPSEDAEDDNIINIYVETFDNDCYSNSKTKCSTDKKNSGCLIGLYRAAIEISIWD